jgi:hypothetical protein
MKLNDEVVDFLLNGGRSNIVLVSTVSEFGVVNLSPRAILDIDRSGPEDKIYFNHVFPNKTLYNLRKNPKASVSKYISNVNGIVKMVVITGRANNLTSGDKYEELAKLGPQRISVVRKGIISEVPKPVAITEFIVEEVELYP